MALELPRCLNVVLGIGGHHLTVGKVRLQLIGSNGAGSQDFNAVAVNGHNGGFQTNIGNAAVEQIVHPLELCLYVLGTGGTQSTKQVGTGGGNRHPGLLYEFASDLMRRHANGNGF